MASLPYILYLKTKSINKLILWLHNDDGGQPLLLGLTAGYLLTDVSLCDAIILQYFSEHTPVLDMAQFIRTHFS